MVRAWPWLRQEELTGSPQEHWDRWLESLDGKLYFDRLSAVLSDMYSEKSRIMLALRKTRDVDARSVLQAQLQDLQAQIARASDAFGDLSNTYGDAYKGVRCLTNKYHVADEYNLQGLPEYKIRSAGFKCPDCAVSVLMSKQPVNFGNGIKLTLLSCHCRSRAVTLRKGHIRFALTPENWAAGEEANDEPAAD